MILFPAFASIFDRVQDTVCFDQAAFDRGLVRRNWEVGRVAK
jgi:hypothetical protein